MHDSQRKVHKLRIISQDESTLSSAVNALQDAFNIASFPGLPPNGLLLIKKFDLGVFSSHSTSLAISRLIDDKIQALSDQSLCVDNEEHAEHDVVWFSDPAQALYSFISLIIKQKQPRAWYWPVIFPSWRVSMNLADVMFVVCKDLKQQETKPYVMAGIIQQLLAERQFEEILTATTPQLAKHLLSDAGIYPHVIAADRDEQQPVRETFFYMQPAWQVLISKAVFNWGKEDVRTLWLTFSALIQHNPALSGNQQLLNCIATVMDVMKNDDYKKERSDYAGKEAGIKENKNDVVLEGLRLIEPDSTFACIADKSHSDYQKTSFKSDKKLSQSARFDAIDNITNEHGCSTSLDYSGFVSAEHCGLAFIISLLELLSINKLLILNPFLAELNFPVRMIRLIAQRFCISNEHPVLQSLPVPQKLNYEIVEHFTSPASWQCLRLLPQLDNKLLYLFNIKGYDSACYITDRTKKLLLYAGEKDKQRFPSWLLNYEIKHQAGVYAPAKLSDLENTIQLLSSRYLHRFACIGLRQLINRKGHIAITKTHIDVLFDTAQIDDRIRIAGLDINPGWVFWLARVVQFHYDSEVISNA
jgi:hypothetical protein